MGFVTKYWGGGGVEDVMEKANVIKILPEVPSKGI